MGSNGTTCNSSEPHLEDVANTIFVVKVLLSSFAMLVSLIVIGVIVVMKTYKQFVYRLVIYIMAVNILLALFQVLAQIPIEVK